MPPPPPLPKWMKNRLAPSQAPRRNDDSGPMLEIQRRVLRMCRTQIVRDLDVVEVMDQLIQDGIVTTIMKNDIMSRPTCHDRASALLDKLETRGSTAFSLFHNALNLSYKHLAVTLENAMLDAIQQEKEDEYQNSYLSGGALQTAIRSKKSMATRENDDDDDEIYDMSAVAEEETYIDCYDAMPTRFASKTDSKRQRLERNQSAKDYNEINFTAVLKNALYFKEIPFDRLPKEIPKPPCFCKIFIPFVMPEKDNRVTNVNESQNDNQNEDVGPKSDGEIENESQLSVDQKNENEEIEEVSLEEKRGNDDVIKNETTSNADIELQDTETEIENTSFDVPEDVEITSTNIKDDREPYASETGELPADACVDRCSPCNETFANVVCNDVTVESPDVVVLPKNEIVIVNKTKINIPDVDPFTKCFDDTYLVFDKLNHAYYVPVEDIKKYGDPEGEVWFYPVELSSRQATLMLSHTRQDGCFLVYRSTNKGSGAIYTLSVAKESGEVSHYHIKEEKDQTVRIQHHDRAFLTIDELVTYFQQNKNKLVTRLRRPLCQADDVLTPGVHYGAEWELNRDDIELNSELGKGNFGVVWLGRYKKKHYIAVKALQKVNLKISDQDDFFEEAKVLMVLEHEHILKLTGLSCNAFPFYIITEFVRNGNLRECLKNGTIKKNNVDGLCDLCIQITSGMRYLENRKYVLHRDLAARNCLLDENCTVKIADFGMARQVTDDAYQAPKSEKIPVKWAAPEVLQESLYSTKSDVWSAAVVFWEIFSGGERPFVGMLGEDAAFAVVEGRVHLQPKLCPNEMYRVMRMCWKFKPEERPSFHVLYDKLRAKSTMYYETRDLRKDFLRCQLGESRAWQLKRRSSMCQPHEERTTTGDTLEMNFAHRHEKPPPPPPVLEVSGSVEDDDRPESEYSVDDADDKNGNGELQKENPSLKERGKTSSFTKLFTGKKKKKQAEEGKRGAKFYVEDS